MGIYKQYQLTNDGIALLKSGLALVNKIISTVEVELIYEVGIEQKGAIINNINI